VNLLNNTPPKLTWRRRHQGDTNISIPLVKSVTGMWMYDVLGDFIHIMKGPCGCCGRNGTVKALSSLRGLPMQPPFTMDTRKIPWATCKDHLELTWESGLLQKPKGHFTHLPRAPTMADLSQSFCPSASKNLELKGKKITTRPKIGNF